MFCLILSMPAHGSRLSDASRLPMLSAENLFGVSFGPSSSHVIGVDTVAPGRARVE